MADVERDPTKIETAILEVLMAPDFPGRDEIRACLTKIKVSTIDNYGSLKLHSVNCQKADTIATIPVEGRVLDKDAVPIYVLLHAPDGIVNELEIYKADGSEILDRGKLLDLEVITYPPGI